MPAGAPSLSERPFSDRPPSLVAHVSCCQSQRVILSCPDLFVFSKILPFVVRDPTRPTQRPESRPFCDWDVATKEHMRSEPKDHTRREPAIVCLFVLRCPSSFVCVALPARQPSCTPAAQLAHLQKIATATFAQSSILRVGTFVTSTVSAHSGSSCGS